MSRPPRRLKTTVHALQDEIRAFVDERDWSRFHAPRNLAAAISVEAAELLDIFKWSSGRESVERHLPQIRDEVADVMIYCLSLCNQVGIDAADAIHAKVVKNAEKYPVGRYKGKWR